MFALITGSVFAAALAAALLALWTTIATAWPKIRAALAGAADPSPPLPPRRRAPRIVP